MFYKNSSIRRKTIAIAFVMVLWCTAVSYGTVLLYRYSNTPGVVSLVAIDRLPEEVARLYGHTRERLKSDLLLVCVHPKCPCTRATISEIQRLQGSHPELAIEFLVYSPALASSDWVKTDLWYDALRLSGREPHIDVDGKISEALGATTSGHALLVNSERKILYSGGITFARGHEGYNAGIEAIDRRLQRNSDEKDTGTLRLPTFGCPIVGDRKPSLAYALQPQHSSCKLALQPSDSNCQETCLQAKVTTSNALECQGNKDE